MLKEAYSKCKSKANHAPAVAGVIYSPYQFPVPLSLCPSTCANTEVKAAQPKESKQSQERTHTSSKRTEWGSQSQPRERESTALKL